MLYSANIIMAVVRALGSWPSRPLVVDPVMVSTSGRRLLDHSAVKVLKTKLLPHATMVTPNLHEAEVLADIAIRSLEDMQKAAREIYSRFGCDALVKGGHLKDTEQAIDVFFDGDRQLLLKSPRVRGVRTHGTGCTYSAAITAYLARGEELRHAIRLAKKFITLSIAGSRRIGRHFVSGLF
jgi:hydroxymethylpyrimidine/phosphomethylpyrimidine kinase